MTNFRNGKPDLLFILSVDTEEEWDWSGQFPRGDFQLSNVKVIPEFHEFCDSLGIRTTYFVDYAVAADEQCADVLRGLIESGNCEVGAHLHPWANPPYFGQTHERESHVVNLPVPQIKDKLDTLLHALKENLALEPRAFRTGRWGVNGDILALLRDRGLSIDSSMYPGYKNEFFDCEGTPLAPYYPDFELPTRPGAQRDIFEIPVTVGFNWRNQTAGRFVYNNVTNPALAPLRLVGALWQSRVLRKLYLSPEVISGKEMFPLVDMVIANRIPTLHMFMHSSSLLDNGRGMMSHPNALKHLSANVSSLLEYAQSKANITFCTISEASALLRSRFRVAA